MDVSRISCRPMLARTFASTGSFPMLKATRPHGLATTLLSPAVEDAGATDGQDLKDDAVDLVIDVPVSAVAVVRQDMQKRRRTCYNRFHIRRPDTLPTGSWSGHLGWPISLIHLVGVVSRAC